MDLSVLSKVFCFCGSDQLHRLPPARLTSQPRADNRCPVSRLKKLAALLLVALWLPATLHCQLEGLGLDALFACPTGSDQAAHADKGDCADDACQLIETGQITFAKARLDLNLLPALACACHLCLFDAGPPAPAPEISASRQDETLPLQRTWQFARRAALPARAPDALNAARA